jgi:uncharacterized protein YbjT (DUF2867 family)
LLPGIAWRGADLASLRTEADWFPFLTGIDAVVNASGALQDGAMDNLAAAQDTSIRALIAACEKSGARRFVQISAPGADKGAATAFMRTKAMADAALRRSSLAWTIFKPGLVISAYAYGGTALMRMLAAFPLVQPLVHGGAKIQTVAASDVAEAVSVALASERLNGLDIDLVERSPRTLREIIAGMRAWLGFDAAVAVIEAPAFVGAGVARVADMAGWLGWRSPLRTTALRVLANNVLGDADAGERALGRSLKSLEQSLRALPATLQERTAARAQLVFPVLAITLAMFWIVSGIVAILHTDAATAVLSGTAAEPFARALVIGGALLDIAIGAGVCVRAWTRAAAGASIGVALAYLALGTILTPALWSDPLGPFVKVLPAIALGVAVAALAERR